MARQQAPRRLYPGVWRETDHLVAVVSAGNSRTGRVRERRSFPLGTDYRTVILPWQLKTQSELLRAIPATTVRGALAADIARYLATIPEGPYQKNAAGILAHWANSPLAARPTTELTRLDLEPLLARWRAAGAAVNTCNKRLTKFRMMFAALYPNAVTPALGIKFKKEPAGEQRDIPPRIVKLILEQMPDVGRAEKGGDRPTVSLTKVRLAVMAWTGQQGATLRRVTKAHLDLENARVYLTPREKGRGAPAAWVSLLPPAVEAFRAFVAAGQLGKPWARSSMWKSWAGAVARARVAAARHAELSGDDSWRRDFEKLPPNCHPYDLRHAFASEIYRRTGDLGAVAELLQHAELETTRRYTKGAVSERVSVAISKASAAYAAVPSMPPPPRMHLVKKGGAR